MEIEFLCLRQLSLLESELFGFEMHAHCVQRLVLALDLGDFRWLKEEISKIVEESELIATVELLKVLFISVKTGLNVGAHNCKQEDPHIVQCDLLFDNAT